MVVGDHKPQTEAKVDKTNGAQEVFSIGEEF